MIETLGSTLTSGALLAVIGVTVVGFRNKATWRWYALAGAIGLPFALLLLVQILEA